MLSSPKFPLKGLRRLWLFGIFFNMTCSFASFIVVQMFQIKLYMSHFFFLSSVQATWIIAHFEHKHGNLLNVSCIKPSELCSAAWHVSLGKRNGKLAKSNFIPWHISKLTLRTHFPLSVWIPLWGLRKGFLHLVK